MTQEAQAKSRKIIQDPNLTSFVLAVVAAVKEGYEIDEQNPPVLYGYLYETHLLIDENAVPVHKPSRAEILGNARKAKKDKASTVQEPQEPALEPVEEPVDTTAVVSTEIVSDEPTEPQAETPVPQEPQEPAADEVF